MFPILIQSVVVSDWEIDGKVVPSDKYQIVVNQTVPDNSGGVLMYTVTSLLDTNTSVAPPDIWVQCTARQGEPYNYEVKSGIYNISYFGTFTWRYNISYAGS